jgi:nicotinamide riboside transporter PnuC
MYPFFHAIGLLLSGSWGALPENALEWSATLVSLIGFYLCIKKKPSSFLIFLWADASWGLSAYLVAHWALVVQQVFYMGMNVAGYLIWKREEAEELAWEAAHHDLQQQVKTLSAKLAEFDLANDEDNGEEDEDEEHNPVTPVPIR